MLTLVVEESETNHQNQTNPRFAFNRIAVYFWSALDFLVCLNCNLKTPLNNSHFWSQRLCVFFYFAFHTCSPNAIGAKFDFKSNAYTLTRALLTHTTFGLRCLNRVCFERVFVPADPKINVNTLFDRLWFEWIWLMASFNQLRHFYVVPFFINQTWSWRQVFFVINFLKFYLHSCEHTQPHTTDIFYFALLGDCVIRLYETDKRGTGCVKRGEGQREKKNKFVSSHEFF